MYFEAPALLADAVCLRHWQPVEEHLVRVHGLAAHLLDLAHFDVAAIEVGVESVRPSCGRAHSSIGVVRASSSTFLGDLRGRDPDLLARDQVAVALLVRLRLDPRRIEAGVRLGDGEARALLAGDQPGQHAFLLFRGAEHDDRVEAEDIHVHRRGTREAAAGFGDRLHQDRRFGDAEPRAAVLLRHRDAEPAVLRERPCSSDGKPPSLSFFSQYSSPNCAHSFATASRSVPVGREGEIHQVFLRLGFSSYGRRVHTRPSRARW
jgi:hypothetical protein